MGTAGKCLQTQDRRGEERGQHCGGPQSVSQSVSPVILLIIGGKMFPSALDIVIDNMHVVGYNYYFKL